MPVSKPLPRHLRAAREKIYGPARGNPLDRNAKARVMAYAHGYNCVRALVGQPKWLQNRLFLTNVTKPRGDLGLEVCVLGVRQRSGRKAAMSGDQSAQHACFRNAGRLRCGVG
jgi:hypothetical protein